MTFYTWMMKKYKGQDSPEGDLASDMELLSKEFPRNRGTDYKSARVEIVSHMRNHLACREALQTFAKCWTRYVLHETHYHRDWARKHKEQVNAYQREYAKTHREKIKAYHKKYRANHKDEKLNAGKMTPAKQRALDSIESAQPLSDGMILITSKDGKKFIYVPEKHAIESHADTML